MEFQLNPSGREPIYRQIVRQVREGIAQGRLRAGAQLPSVRELSRSLVVNPNTVARAYTELEREGTLQTQPGRGVFIAEVATDLTRTARRKKLAARIDELLTEAVHLEFSLKDVQQALADRAQQFEWKADS